MTITIRRYRENEINKCLDGIESFLNEDRGDDSYTNHYKDVDFDRHKMYSILKRRWSDPDFFCSLILDDGEVVGGLVAIAMEPIWSSEKIAYDQLFYVFPTFHNVKAVFRLIQLYTEWAQQRGVVECHLCSSTGYKQEGFTKLCNRVGFEQFEVGFARRF